jgi:large subunit ribosomal protein L24
MAAKIKKGDRVVVLTGKDKGRTGEVARVLPTENRVVVTGINMVQRHTRPSQGDPQGGIKNKEASIHVSNVAIVDANGKATRVGFRMDGDKKVRFAKTTGDVI